MIKGPRVTAVGRLWVARNDHARNSMTAQCLRETPDSGMAIRPPVSLVPTLVSAKVVNWPIHTV